MRQRVALARALAQDADVLLMDEPFGALDAMTRDLLHDELERLWQQTGSTVVFVTHNVREAVRLGDRVVLLSSRPGRVAAEFPVDIPRPRRIDSPEVGALAAEITDRLREEVRPPCPLTTVGPSVLDPSTTISWPSELAGLDALGVATRPAARLARRAMWSAAWPKLAAIAIALLAWQLVVWSGWKPELRPARAGHGVPRARRHDPRRQPVEGHRPRRCGGPSPASPSPSSSAALRRPGRVARSASLRVAVGSLITGLQTMPSIAWFPLAIVLFKLQRGGDPLRRRARRGTVDRQRRDRRHRQHPADPHRAPAGCSAPGGSAATATSSCPPRCRRSSAACKQGWAFAWRSLLAGELLVIIANKPSIGSTLEFSRSVSDYPGMMATMLVILIIGVLIDTFVFTQLDRAILRRRGLVASR